MKLLRCKVCGGEVDIIEDELAILKKIKCNKCGFSNLKDSDKKPVIIIKKRNFS